MSRGIQVGVVVDLGVFLMQFRLAVTPGVALLGHLLEKQGLLLACGRRKFLLLHL